MHIIYIMLNKVFYKFFVELYQLKEKLSLWFSDWKWDKSTTNVATVPTLLLINGMSTTS